MKTPDLLVLILLMLNSASLISQDRVSKPIPKIGSKISGQLIKSTGWVLNPESQWVSRPNRIPSFIENNYKSLIDFEYDGLGLDNFISYQIRDIKIQDSTYSILIKKYKDGDYKYRSIKKGWINYNSLMFYVFNKSELSKLDYLVNDSINLVKLDVLYWNSLTIINNETYISDIEKEIVKQIDKKTDDSRSKVYLVFHISPYKKKNIVQFQIYSTYGGILIGGMIKEHKIKDENGRFAWDQKRIYLSNELFKNCYYEVDYLTFNSFIKIIE